MRKKLMKVAVASALGLAAAPVISADVKTDSTQKQAATQNQSYWGIKASDLVDMKVKNAQGEQLGEINDVIVDVKNGQAHYAVMSFDAGGLGLGNKTFAYPLSAFSRDTDDKLTLNIDREKLRNAEGFDNNNRPDWNDAKYQQHISRYFSNASPVAEDARLVRVSDVLDQDINARDGSEIGEVDELVINLRNGKVHYVTAELDAWGFGDKLFALPLTAFSYNTESDDLVLNVNKDRIDTERGFDANDWPNINDPNYVRDVDLYLVTLTPVATDTQPGAAGRSGTPSQSTDKSAQSETGSSMSDKSQQSGSTK
ncbi:MAG: PRC-barrel domain-containing protein [Burkholderiales bacterium]